MSINTITKYTLYTCIIIVTLVSNSFAVENNMSGKWIEYVDHENNPLKKQNGLLINITNEHINVLDRLNNTNYTFSTKDNITYEMYLNKKNTNKKIVKINNNMMLFYENTEYSPIVMLRDGFKLVNKNKKVFGKWIYIDKDFTSLKYDIGKNKITRTSSDNKATDIFRFRYTNNEGLRMYSHDDIFYEVVLIAENLAIMYITVPSNIGREVRVLQKQSEVLPKNRTGVIATNPTRRTHHVQEKESCPGIQGKGSACRSFRRKKP